MKKLLLLPFCLLWSTLCFSQNWFCITGTDDARINVDVSSIERNGSIIYCWQKTTYDNEDARLEEANRLYGIWKNKAWLKYDHSLNYIAYECPGKKSQTLSSVYYDSNGKIIHSNDENESSINYKRLIPGTVGMSILNTLNDMHLFEVDGEQYMVYIEHIPSFLYKNQRKAEYLGDNLGIKLMTLTIILECLENDLEKMNLDSN